MERSLRAENQFDSSSRFDRIPACDGRTDGRTDRHMTTANTALASRRAVKNIHWHMHTCRLGVVMWHQGPT